MRVQGFVFFKSTVLQVQGVFGGGFDTFSALSGWLFVYFGVFPDQTNRARNEVDKFFDDHHHLPRLVCDKSVIKISTISRILLVWLSKVVSGKNQILNQNDNFSI